MNLSRAFLDTNGAPKEAKVRVGAPRAEKTRSAQGIAEAYRALAGDLNVCSKRGLAERFDSTIGAGSVLRTDAEPYGVYAGVPARKIRDLRTGERCEK